MNNFYKLTTMSFLLAGCITAGAARLSPEGSLTRAINSDGKLQAKAAKGTALQHVRTLGNAIGEASLYIYSNQSGETLFLSASDLVAPVLGYTDAGQIDASNLPPQLEGWLGHYCEQIEAAENNPAAAGFRAPALPKEWAPVEPLVKSQWDQSGYYNLLTPDKRPTGCVATAMAQIMYYWKFPEVGRGSVSYYWSDGERTLSMNFEEKKFEWDKMTDKYTVSSSSDAKNAVSYLMQACGYSSHMQYFSNSSGTQPEYTVAALVNNFKYDGAARNEHRYNYSYTEWATMLYDQLKQNQPVLYSGDSPSVGHAFVCDGYNGEGYFHFNWGWSGAGDGFFLLDALSPDTHGTGGSDFGGFNYRQAMIVDIKKGNNQPVIEYKPELTMLGHMTAKGRKNGFTFSFSEAYPATFMNCSSMPVDAEFGWLLVNTETQARITGKVDAVFVQGQEVTFPPLEPGAFMSRPLSIDAIVPADLADGKYKLQLVWKEKKGTEYYNLKIQRGCYDYAWLSVTDGTYSTEAVTMDKRFEILDMEVVSPLYRYEPCKIKFTIRNESDQELTQGVVPVLYQNSAGRFEGDSRLITVPANSTVDIVQQYYFSTLVDVAPPAIFVLGAYDYELLRYGAIGDFPHAARLGDASYGTFGEVTMYPQGSTGTLVCNNINIGGDDSENNGNTPSQIFVIDDFSEIPVSVLLYAKSAPVKTTLTAKVSEYDVKSGTNGAAVLNKEFEDEVGLNGELTRTFSTTLSMGGKDTSKVYILEVTGKNAQQPLAKIKFSGESSSSAVQGILAGNSEAFSLTKEGDRVIVTGDNLQTVELYTTSGILLTRNDCAGNATAVVSLNGLDGMLIVVARDGEGNSRIFKVIK